MAKISEKKREELRAKIAKLTEELPPIPKEIKGRKSYQRERVQSVKKTAQRMGKLWAGYAKERAAILRGYLEH